MVRFLTMVLSLLFLVLFPSDYYSYTYLQILRKKSSKGNLFLQPFLFPISKGNVKIDLALYCATCVATVRLQWKSV